jgi:hypothetical protein
MARAREPIPPEQLTVVPAKEAWWDDLEARVGLAIAGQRPGPVIYRPIGYGKRMGFRSRLLTFIGVLEPRRHTSSAVISPPVAARTKTLRRPEHELRNRSEKLHDLPCRPAVTDEHRLALSVPRIRVIVLGADETFERQTILVAIEAVRTFFTKSSPPPAAARASPPGGLRPVLAAVGGTVGT